MPSFAEEGFDPDNLDAIDEENLLHYLQPSLSPFPQGAIDPYTQGLLNPYGQGLINHAFPTTAGIYSMPNIMVSTNWQN